MCEVMTYNQFAAKHRLVTDYDVQGHIHAGLMAAHMPNSYHRRYKKRLLELQESRAEGQRLYQEAIERGEVSEPNEMSLRERLEARANGHPDLASTQAAIRTLARLKARAEEEAPLVQNWSGG
jgi:predicted transposase YdaD